MTTPAPTSAKICIRCGMDCSGRPRTKDQHGRYTCRECFDARQGEQAIVLPPAAAPRRAEHRIEPSAEAVPLALEGEGEGEGDDGVYAMLLEGAAKDAARVTSSPCPGCGRPLRSDAALCVHCGYNVRTGKAVETKQATGGAAVIDAEDDPLVQASRRERRRRNSAAMTMEYVRPAILLVAALGLSFTLIHNREGIEDAVGYLIIYGISLPAGIAGFFLCCMLWLGFDSPLGLTVLRLAAIFAVMDIALVGLNVGIPGIGGIGFRFLLPLLIGTWLMMYLMDLDYEEALLAGILTGAVKLFGTIMLVMWVAKMLSGS